MYLYNIAVPFTYLGPVFASFDFLTIQFCASRILHGRHPQYRILPRWVGDGLSSGTH